MDLEGKVSLITGASGGIGEALAHELASAGGKVVLIARRADRLQQVASAVGSGRALAVPGDVTSSADLQAAVRAAEEEFGGLDILVNNAGVAVVGRLETMAPELMEQGFRINVFGPVLALQAALPAIERRGGGMIVNISSGMSLRPSPTMSIYSATKAALNVISASLREEVRDRNIKVLTVHPGLIANDFGINSLFADEELAEQRRSRSRTRTERTSEDAAREIIDAMRQDLEVARLATSQPANAPL